jgi:predicted ATPase
MKSPNLRRIKIENFKAIQNSGSIKLTPLTVFIGNNGSGKSSIIEGLLTYQMIIQQGLDDAINYWRGFDYIRNRAVPHTLSPKQRPQEINPINIKLNCKDYNFGMSITQSPSGEVFISEETITISVLKSIGFIHDIHGRFFRSISFNRDVTGSVNYHSVDHDNAYQSQVLGKVTDTQGILDLSAVQEQLRQLNHSGIYSQIADWQFINFNPAIMGNPIPPRLSADRVKLAPNASNLGHYLLDLYKLDIDAFNGLVETLQYVLPYAKDLQVQATSPAELERRIYLKMTEGSFQVPGWLLSTGTLRVVAILALLRHPFPPPLIIIEELENGLDPRTINLLVEEIRQAIESGKTQVIITTHSPYLLDLLHLSQIVIVERNEQGEPIFSRPADRPTLEQWSKQFTPGQLYTMGQLNSL